MLESAIKITERYLEVLESLCNEKPESAFIYYNINVPHSVRENVHFAQSHPFEITFKSLCILL